MFFEEFGNPGSEKHCGKCDCRQHGDMRRLLIMELMDISEHFRNTR